MKFLLKFFLCVTLLSSILLFDFFYVNNYAAYPWWHQKGNDIDGAYTATTVGLLNNTELGFVYHPGATVFMIHGTIYRMLNLTDLSGIRDINGAIDILDKIVRTSRVVAVLLGIIFIVIFFGFLYVVSGHFLLSFFISFYVISSQAFLEHIYMIRAEMPNLIFFFSALLILLSSFKAKEVSFWKFIRVMTTTGFLIGLAVFSKIQIGPAVVACVAGTGIYLFWNDRYGKALLAYPKSTWVCLSIALLNGLVMPWWALNRPDFLTAEYVQTLQKHSALRYVYGPAPASFFQPALILFLILAAISVGIILWQSSRKSEYLLQKIFPVLVFVHCLILGAIVSAYIVLLPVSVSFSQYFDNTQHLVYSVLTNVIYGKFLTNPILNGETFVKIFEIHASRSLLLNVNILIIVGIAAAGCFVRLALRSTKDKWRYLLILMIFVLGLTLDILSTMHWKTIRLYHAIYSICFYATGLLVWISFELRNLQERGRIKFFQVAQGVALAILGLQLLIVSLNLFKQPRATGVSTQDPAVEFLNVKTLAQPFWRVVNENIQKNSHAR